MNNTNPDLTDVKVSVCMITYNQDRYVTQAIESVLMQETDFSVELVIGEDCSTDSTRAIVAEFSSRYLSRIRPLLPEHNLGMIPNFVATLKACRGQYIAICEGDDYWTDPYKLQKQVEFLESHLECSLCFHDAMVVYDDPQRVAHRHCTDNQEMISKLDDLLLQNYIPTLSVLFRRGLFGELPSWYFTLAVGDWPLHLLNAQYGHIGYINEIMGVYRVHTGGIWSWRVSAEKIHQMLPLYGHLYGYLAAAHRPTVRMAASKAIAAGAAATYESSENDRLGSSLSFVRTALAAGSAAGYADRSFKQRTWARSYEALGFTAFQERDMRLARLCFACALALDPKLAKNKGIWSLLFETCFGEQASVVRKRILQRWYRIYQS